MFSSPKEYVRFNGHAPVFPMLAFTHHVITKNMAHTLPFAVSVRKNGIRVELQLLRANPSEDGEFVGDVANSTANYRVLTNHLLSSTEF